MRPETERNFFDLSDPPDPPELVGPSQEPTVVEAVAVPASGNDPEPGVEPSTAAADSAAAAPVRALHAG